jgi:ABC-type multidrug transport system fused ATPase/permease subunit
VPPAFAPVLADFSLGDAFLSVLWFCGLLLWIALAVTVFFDIFRSHDLSGWAKALWVIFIVVLPLLGVLIYLIARGGSMHERSAQQAQQQQDAFKAYVQSVSPQGGNGGSASELHKAAELREKGVITDEEFARLKAKALA